MTKWLQSGPRRDLCVVLYGAGELRGQAAKARLQDHYGERVDAKRFDGMLRKLVEAGHVQREVEGIHDVYSLTEAGERALEDHFEWARETAGV